MIKNLILDYCMWISTIKEENVKAVIAYVIKVGQNQLKCLSKRKDLHIHCIYLPVAGTFLTAFMFVSGFSFSAAAVNK